MHGLWPGNSQHIDAKEPQAGTAGCAPPPILLCKALSRYCSLEPAQGLQKDQRKPNKPRLLPSFSCHRIWQDVPVTREPQELVGSELTVDSWLSRWNGASPGLQPPILQLPVPSWTETSHPSRVVLSFTPRPLLRLTFHSLPCPSSFDSWLWELLTVCPWAS